MPSDFDTFWAAYPRKVAKLDAIKAYGKARALATAEDILAGVQQYVAHLPDEMRFVAHPASWLNKGRWMDEYEPRPVQRTASDWSADCQRLHGGQCVKRWDHEMRMRTEGAA